MEILKHVRISGELLSISQIGKLLLPIISMLKTLHKKVCYQNFHLNLTNFGVNYSSMNVQFWDALLFPLVIFIPDSSSRVLDLVINDRKIGINLREVVTFRGESCGDSDSNTSLAQCFPNRSKSVRTHAFPNLDEQARVDNCSYFSSAPESSNSLTRFTVPFSIAYMSGVFISVEIPLISAPDFTRILTQLKNSPRISRTSCFDSYPFHDFEFLSFKIFFPAVAQESADMFVLSSYFTSAPAFTRSSTQYALPAEAANIKVVGFI